MHKNVGKADMVVRLIAGGLFSYIGFLDNPIVSSGVPKSIFAVFGVIVLLSALARNCPLYYLAGINTDHKVNS